MHSRTHIRAEERKYEIDGSARTLFVLVCSSVLFALLAASVFFLFDGDMQRVALLR